MVARRNRTLKIGKNRFVFKEIINNERKKVLENHTCQASFKFRRNMAGWVWYVKTKG